MKNRKFEKKLLPYCLVLFLSTLIFTSIMVSLPVVSLEGLKIHVVTGKPSYYMRENVDIYANLTLNETPVDDSLIGIEIDNPNGSPVICRTLNTSNYDKIEDIKISNVTPGVILVSKPFNPKNIFKIGDYPDFEVTVQNDGTVHVEHAIITICVYDAINTLLFSSWTEATIAAGGTTIPTFSMGAGIQNWATIGEARVYVNVFTKFPKNLGDPLCKEKSCSFTITNKEGDEIEPSGNPIFNPSRIKSTYALTSRLEPSPMVGNHRIYAIAVYDTGLARNSSAEFVVNSGSYPPQAEFTWSPPEPYNNQNVEFDASASTSYGAPIIKYEWDWKTDGVFDANGILVSTEYVTAGDYDVTLKVTDSSGKWARTTRPIKILPPSPPQASFIYSKTDLTVNFDATNSTSGWDGTGFSPIVSYNWNFDDQNTTTVSNPTIVHKYWGPGIYNVTLTVTDARSWSDTTWQLINVTMASGLIGDLNGDGIVDIFDIVTVAIAFGSIPGDISWNPIADVNDDNLVDIFDVVTVAIHFGEHL